MEDLKWIKNCLNPLFVVPQFAGVGEWYKQVLCCACEENSGVGVNIPALDFSFFLGRKK